MNELIQDIFQDFSVDGVAIPVRFLRYVGSAKQYVIYMQEDASGSYSGDDDLLGYADYYDFDVYCHADGELGGNYTGIVEAIKTLLKANGFVWQVSKSSSDMYETDTGYYHKTLNFAILRQEGE